MESKKESFETAATNIEIDIVRNEIRLLREYAQISDTAEKEKFMSRFHPIMRKIIQQGILTPNELIPRLDRAIKLDKYRPRNLSLFMLAISPDLYNIHGKFDTFDIKLSQMFHAPVRDDFAIRNEFNGATLNRFDLAKQMTQYWLRRASMFPTQLAAARNATPENAVAAYTELFNLLLSEFMREYKWDNKKATITINVQDSYLRNPDGTLTRVSALTKLGDFQITIPTSTPKSEYQKIIDEFIKNPKAHPLAREKIVIHFSLQKLMDDAKITNKSFFDTVFAAFAHEMQHILDTHIPRMGAMGPQITEIDAETYVEADTNIAEYHKTARELSAYAVTGEMLTALSKQNS